jgi:polyhydroxyalkanoate synthesis regulator phasin
MSATDDITTILQKTFHVSLGATAAFVEMLQDPEKRTVTVETMLSDLDKFTAELAAKGAVTEVEARNFVDSFISDQINKKDSPASSSESGATDASSATVDTAANEVGDRPAGVDESVESDIKDLTDQLAALRSELEKSASKIATVILKLLKRLLFRFITKVSHCLLLQVLL